jgi:hypothetical protein
VEASMVLLVAAASVGSVVVAVLLSYCYWMFRDVSEAEEELHQRVIEFYRVALDAKGIEDNIETVNAVYHRGRPYSRILNEIAD